MNPVPRARRRSGGRYANVKRAVASDGVQLDSMRERDRYEELLLLKRAGEVIDLEVHKRFALVVGGIPIKYASGRQAVYVADFVYIRPVESGTVRYGGNVVIEDVKMDVHRDRVYKLKRAIMLAMGHEITEISQ